MAQIFARFIVSASSAPLLQDGPVLSTGLLAVIAILLIILFIWLLLRWRADRPARPAVTRSSVTSTPARPAVKPIAPDEAEPMVPATAAPAASAVEVYPAPDAPVVETSAAAVPPFVDDLEIIEGIGPKIAHVLNDAGVTTFVQLAQMDPDQISAILQAAGLRLADPHSWPEQARLAAAGDQAGLQALQDRLKAGRAS